MVGRESATLDVVMPKWGLTMTEALVVRWLCAEGDEVTRDQAIVEVETEKANAEVPSPADGVIEQIVAAPGSVVGVGNPLAVMRTPDRADRGSTATAVAATFDVAPPAVPAVTEPAREPTSVVPGRDGRASPLARRIARELGVDISSLQGTGTNRLIVERDVRAAAEAVSPSVPQVGVRVGGGGSRIETLSAMRRAIARSMSRSLVDAPQLTVMREVGVAGLRAALAETDGATATDVFVAAAARALVQHPRLNAHFTDAGIELFENIDLGLAVALDDGLVTPVIRRANDLSLTEVARERQRLVEAARARELSQAELVGSTFTLTNLGGYGIDAFTPILNPPEVAILGVGAIRQVPVVANGAVVPGESCVLSLTFDHRALDGAPAALLLGTLAVYLEHPFQLAKALA